MTGYNEGVLKAVWLGKKLKKSVFVSNCVRDSESHSRKHAPDTVVLAASE